MTKRTTVAAAGLCVAVALAGCTSHPDTAGPSASSVPAPAKAWPESLKDFSIVWSAEPGIDLTAGPAVPLRAYTESYFLAAATGDLRYLYPGFSHAVGPNSEWSNPAGKQALWPSTSEPSEFIGTQQDHILRITRNDNAVTAVVCIYTYASAVPEDNGKFRAVASGLSNPGPGIYVARIQLAAPAQSGAMQPQAGPNKAASSDVFGDWKVTDHLGGFLVSSGLYSEWPEQEQDRAQCIAKAPNPQEQQTALIFDGPHPITDFPAQAPYPGWPAAAS